MASVKGAGEKIKEKAREKAAGAGKKLRSAKERLGQVKGNLGMSGRKAVGDYAKEKLGKARADRRYAAIYVIELALIAVIVFSIAVFVDDWAQLTLLSSLEPGQGFFMPPPYSYLVFILVLVLVFLLYRYTREFRKSE